MKLLVIGAGYVGRALLKKLQDEQHEVYVSTTDPEKVAELKLLAQHVFVLKAGDHAPLDRAMAQCEAVVVLVAPKNHETHEATYLQTARLLVQIAADQPTAPYILYTSSTSVYEGSRLSEWTTEDDLLSPLSSNAKILQATELTYQKIPSHCILRLGGIFGPEREIFKRASRLSGKVMPGTGREPTNHIHRDDIVSAISFCLNNRLCGTYNLVNDAHPSRQELYGELCSKYGLEAPVWSGVPYSAYKVSNVKIKEAGFHFQHAEMT